MNDQERDANGLRYSYDYVFFDLSVLLYGSMFFLSRGNTKRIKKNELLKLVLQKIFKPIREWSEDGYILGAKKIVLLHDKRKDGKYLKEVEVGEYKSDRSYGSEDEIDELKKLMDPTYELDIEEVLEIKDEIRKLEIKGENFYTANQVKYQMIKELDKSGVHQLMLTGYEADDLFYQIGKWLKEHNEYGIGISTDTDWVYKTNENLDFYSVKYDNMYPELKENYKSMNESLNLKGVDIDLYTYGVLYELCCYSHNGVTTFLEDHPECSFEDFIIKIINKDDSLPEYDIYSKRYAAMHMDSTEVYDYQKDLQPAVDKVLSEPTDYGKLKQYILDNKLVVGRPCLDTIEAIENIQRSGA